MKKQEEVLRKMEEKIYEMFCDETISLFTKKFLHILLQSMRRVNCDPSIQYFMDTEDWYEALNVFDANDKETLRALTYKHFDSSLKKQLYKQRHAPKYLSNGETVWKLHR
jgi:hypothetical protein